MMCCCCLHGGLALQQPPACLTCWRNPFVLTTPPADALQGHESDGEPASAVEPEQERRMLDSIIGGILGGSDEEEEEEEEEEDSEAGSDEEGSDEEDSDEEGSDEEGSDSYADTAAEPAAAGADPFSRKRLQEKAAAAAAGGDAEPQRQRPEPEAGATVFIRGLPLDVSKEQVFTKMKVSGGSEGHWAIGVQPVWCGRWCPLLCRLDRRLPVCPVYSCIYCLQPRPACTLSQPAWCTTCPTDLRPRALLPAGGGQGVWQAQGHRICGLLPGGLGGEGGRGMRQGQVRVCRSALHRALLVGSSRDEMAGCFNTPPAPPPLASGALQRPSACRTPRPPTPRHPTPPAGARRAPAW